MGWGDGFFFTVSSCVSGLKIQLIQKGKVQNGKDAASPACPLPCPPAVGRPQLFQSDSKRPLIPQSSPVSTQQPPFLPHQTHGQST